MKITKQQLKRIIKEEILKEMGDDERPPMTGQVTSDEEYQNALEDLMVKLKDPQYYVPENPTAMLDDLHALMDRHLPKGGEQER